MVTEGTQKSRAAMCGTWLGISGLRTAREDRYPKRSDKQPSGVVPFFVPPLDTQSDDSVSFRKRLDQR
jgi:hypothetical protein